MANILINNKKFELLDFESEAEFEKAVIENHKALFGRSVVYIDTKRLFGESGSYHKGIPDGYLIDFSSKEHPQLYFVENELATHDIYSHISEQLLRFSTMIQTSQDQIRKKILEVIKSDRNIVAELSEYLKKSSLSNIDELMNFLVDGKIRIVLVIDEDSPDLQLSLSVFKDRPDIVTLQRYIYDNQIAYVYEPMIEELSGLEGSQKKTWLEGGDFDTIICPAFEDGFRRAYLENDAWWAIRLSQKAREQLKYLAIYEKSPIAAVRHLAEIVKIEPYKNSGKFKIYLRNKKKISAIELDKGKKGVAPQSPRFTTYSKLKQAKKISDLWG